MNAKCNRCDKPAVVRLQLVSAGQHRRVLLDEKLCTAHERIEERLAQGLSMARANWLPLEQK